MTILGDAGRSGSALAAPGQEREKLANSEKFCEHFDRFFVTQDGFSGEYKGRGTIHVMTGTSFVASEARRLTTPDSEMFGASTTLQDCMATLKATWLELVDYGHAPCRIHLGLWEHPCLHQIQFLTNDRVIESLPLFIGSASDFDALRRFAHRLSESGIEVNQN